MSLMQEWQDACLQKLINKMEQVQKDGHVIHSYDFNFDKNGFKAVVRTYP